MATKKANTVTLPVVKKAALKGVKQSAAQKKRLESLLETIERRKARIVEHFYDIGVAAGGGKGLVVPVVRNADTLGFAEVEKEIGRLGARARDNKLTLEELSGGTFTISNGGVYGSMLSTPILNPPQTGILGMHNIIRRPIAVGDNIEIRPMMYLALSYDHRVVDGRESVSFLIKVKERLEQPEKLLLGI